MAINHKFVSPYAAKAYSSTRKLWDVPLFESESFVALPTAGMLVKGWILVVPKEPAISIATLPASQFEELESFLDEIVPIIESVYGQVSLFEHGPSSKSTPIGCGVDYAHLHLVPSSVDLLASAKSLAKNIRWKPIEQFSEIRNHHSKNDGYWFFQEVYRKSPPFLGICTDNNPISQLFRRVIANAIGIPDLYDWKSYLGHDMIADTVRELSSVSASHE